MDCCSGLTEPEEMEALEDPGSFGGIKRYRACTDRSFIFWMASFFIILFGFLGYCMVTGDLDRIFYGYDDCGNVCGKNNIKTDAIPYECFGKNMEENKYLLYNYENGEYDVKRVIKVCVKDCEANDAYVDFLNRCFPNSSKNKSGNFTTTDNLFKTLADDFQLCWKNIILLSFLALVFSIIMMVLMRYATAFVVWFVLISISVIFVALSTYFWIRFKRALDENNNEEFGLFLYFALIMTLFTFIFLVLVLVMIKRIKLVIQLFKESAKAIADIPLLLFQPVLTFFVLFFIVFMASYTTLWILSSGYLGKSPEDPRSLDYVLSTFDMFINWYNFVAVLWIIQFVIGCQHIIIAGCVSTWFFSRDKNNLGTPILTSTMNLLKYHLGTVALGSLIITIVQVIKYIVSSLRASARKNNNAIIALIMCFCGYIIQLIEDFLKYFSRNAYIITAIYGHSFCVSGKRALNLLVNNIFKVIAINSVGDYVLLFIKLFIVVSTLLVGTEIFRQNDKIQNLWFPLVIVGCIAYFIAHCFITVFEMAIDTIFLCFCEDCLHNDGLSKPYYMSRNLMEFVEKSNKTLKTTGWEVEEQQAWDNGPKRVLQNAY